jgi:addiction module HigA family antidote
MSQMYNPPHPGLVLREYLGSMDIAEAAQRLGVSRASIEAILACQEPVSADLSLRLSEAMGTHSGFWSGLQMQYDLWQATQIERPRVQPFEQVA